MADKRRQFLKRSGMLLGAVTAPGLLPHTAEARPPAPPPRRTAGAASSVVDFLRTHGAQQVLLRGGSVLGTTIKPVPAALVAVAANPAGIFRKLAAGGTFQGIYATGTTLSFTSQDAPYTVECVTPAGLAELKKRLAAGKDIHFAHEALLQPLDGAAAFDPFNVIPSAGRTLRLAGAAPPSAADGVSAVIGGLVDGAVYKLTAVPAFVQFQERLLASYPVTDDSAAAVANEVAAGIAGLAVYTRADLLQRFIGSRLVSESLRRTFGVSGKQVLTTVRTCPACAEPGSPWLLGILGPERLRIRQGAVWIQDADRFSALQSRTALAGARLIATSL